jgi:phage tail sheath gpL-like
MAITFANIPDTIRTPNVYAEIDSSRALQGLVQNPHLALIVGQRTSAGKIPVDTLVQISREGLADGYFGPGSILSRMCSVFKDNNPNTELWALALADGGAAVAASATLHVSVGLSANGNSCKGGGTFYLMINGQKVYVALTSGWSAKDVNSAIQTTVNGSAYSHLPVKASTNATSALNLIAVCPGEAGNYLDVRYNYYTGQSLPSAFYGDSVLISGFAGGTVNPDLASAWAVIGDKRFHHIIQPYIDSSNLTDLEDELEDRFGPLVDQQGHGYAAVRGTQASCTTLGNSRNSPHNTIIGVYDSPTDPAEWAAALGAVGAWNLNGDPARPLQFLKLKEVLPPPVERRFTRAERDILLYDGISTFIVDTGGSVLTERIITTYQANALGLPDPAYLDIETLFTLGEIRDQFRIRMTNRYLEPRYKLADDTFPTLPGSYVVRPKDVKAECIALFTLLRDKGLIENLEDFVKTSSSSGTRPTATGSTSYCRPT